MNAVNNGPKPKPVDQFTSNFEAYEKLEIPFARTHDAILCSGDIVAAKVMKTVQDIGLRIPEDVIVAGVDDVEIASMTRPSLTTVRQPCADIASAAFDLLEWRVLNPDAAARKLLLRTKLVVRESTRKKERDKP